jgi:hypothetical protein
MRKHEAIKPSSVMLVTAVLADDDDNQNVQLCVSSLETINDGSSVPKPPATKAERCSFSTTPEGGYYEGQKEPPSTAIRSPY